MLQARIDVDDDLESSAEINEPSTRGPMEAEIAVEEDNSSPRKMQKTLDEAEQKELKTEPGVRRTDQPSFTPTLLLLLLSPTARTLYQRQFPVRRVCWTVRVLHIEGKFGAGTHMHSLEL